MVDPTVVQSLTEVALQLVVRDAVRVVISEEVSAPGRRLLRVLDPQKSAIRLAEDVVRWIPELGWTLENLMRYGISPEMVSDIEGIVERHPLSQTPDVARLVRDLCDVLRSPPTSSSKGAATVQIKEEALGRYYGARQTIVLYPKVIGPVADSLGVPEDHLFTVVLAHETAHAVTHLGQDADRNTWDEFPTADSWVKEAMAQYWARVVLGEVDPRSVIAFDLLEQHQSEVYKLWRRFDGLSREQVRTCLVAVRRTRPKATWEFCRGWMAR